MESDPNQMSQSASLCRSGCGFYGNPSNDGLCSKCYKDNLKRKQAAPNTASNSTSNVDNKPPLIASSTFPNNSITSSNSNLNVSAISAQESSSQSSQAEAKVNSTEGQPNNNTTSENNNNNNNNDTSSSSDETPTKSQKKKKSKCPVCKINLGIIQFECRCGLVFCGTHRYANEHNCKFNYKEHGAEEIRKNNPQVIGEKVQKI